MNIVLNGFDGLWAVATDYPITCLNQAPWQITEMKIESRVRGGSQEAVVWIRGEGSCWRRADQCYCDSKEEVENYLRFSGYLK